MYMKCRMYYIKIFFIYNEFWFIPLKCRHPLTNVWGEWNVCQLWYFDSCKINFKTINCRFEFYWLSVLVFPTSFPLAIAYTNVDVFDMHLCQSETQVLSQKSMKIKASNILTISKYKRFYKQIFLETFYCHGHIRFWIKTKIL